LGLTFAVAVLLEVCDAPPLPPPLQAASSVTAAAAASARLTGLAQAGR
jgi:hypothetical protein